MSTRFFFTLGALWSCLFLPVHSLAQDTTGVGAIAGTVKSSDGQPALAVTVCLAETIRCVVTDEVGAFRISEVRAASIGWS